MKKYVIALCIGVLPLVLSASDQINKLKKSWQIINYDENSGFDGSGINLGIIDSVFNDSHKSLQGKDNALINNNFDMGRNDRDGMRHGTHVAGIAIGKKLGDNDPHGIAYNGRYYGLGKNNPGYTYTGNLYEDIKDWDVKIINNSWEAPSYFPLINVTTDGGYQLIQKDTSSIDANYYFNTLLEHKLNRGKQHDALHLIRLSKEKDILNIWGAGNDGRISPSAAAVAASYDEELRAWLVVGALNADGIEVKNENGKRVLTIKSGMCGKYDCSASPAFSNAFKGAALYAITAPGVDIDSANAYYGKTDSLPGADQRPMCSGGEQEEFCGMSGTSQATPMVSGAAMLVQQKFGFLGGAQIADVLLTTANNDFKAPKLTLKYFGTGVLANIIYIDGEIPTTPDGKIDKDKVKQDLRDIGYKDETFLNKILNNAINVDGSPEGIIKLSKEEVFGQGILDVQKALKGLARLDVNRMNKNSVEHFEGENQAFYTIDTKGLSGEFSNDIDQRLWEDKWHIDGAWNSPKEELQNIKKAGLIKMGQGKLTLSGKDNTYQGATRVLQGILEVAQNSKLSRSNVYAEGNGAFYLKGEVSNKLTAKNGGLAQLSGVAKVGGTATAESSGIVQILDSGTIIGGITARDNGIIQLGKVEGGSNTSNVKLATSSVTLQNGGILAGAGTIEKGSEIHTNPQVKNEGGIVMAGFGAERVTNLDSTNNTLKIDGSYTQNTDSTLQIAFSGSLNSKLEATSYDIKGGTLEFVPIYSGEGSLLTAGKTIQLNLGSLKDYTNKFNTILPKSNNVLDFIYDHNNQTLSTTLRADAFKPSGDSTMGEVIKDIFQDPNLSKDYQDYFGAITNASSSLYQASLDSLAQNAPLDSVQDSFNTQQSLSFNALSFALAPVQDTPTYNALRAYKRSVKVASVDNALSGKILSDILSSMQESKHQMIMNANYTLFSHKSHKTSSSGTSFHYKNRISSSLLLGGFLDYAYASANHTYTQLNSHTFTLGGSGIYDLKHFSILGTASVGMGLNATNRTIIGGHTLNADYNTTIFYLQGGVSKDFQVSKVTLKPMALLSYSGVMQGAYEESGGVFARKNSANMYNTFGTSLGLHIGYTLPLESLRFNFSGFGFYNVRFVDSVEAKSSFSDFTNSSFTQKAMLDTHSFYGGVNAQMQYKDYFGRFGLSSEVGGAYTLFNVNASVGMNF